MATGHRARFQSRSRSLGRARQPPLRTRPWPALALASRFRGPSRAQPLGRPPRPATGVRLATQAVPSVA
eukprot:2933249-Alexandrium_andersonii.AAC.1